MSRTVAALAVIPTFLALVLSPLAAAQEAAPAASGLPGAADYAALLEWRFADPGLRVPADGLAFEHDAALWRLESGEIVPMAPIAGGAVTGLLFSGRGEMRMTVPHEIERRHLARMSRRPVSGTLTVPFESLVLRTSEPSLAGDLVAAAGGDAGSLSYAPSDVAARVHRRWLTEQITDVDARVVVGLLTPGDRFLRVEMETDAFGRLIWEHDGLRREEVELTRLDRNGFAEVWVSHDRAEDRRPDGAPDGERRGVLDIRHLDVDIDLTGRARSLRAGASRTRLRDASIRAELTFVPNVDGLRALPLQLSAWSEVLGVWDEGGRPLVHLRDNIGRRTRDLDKEVFDPSLVVLLAEPLAAGRPAKLVVEYEILLSNFGLGRSWYPDLADNYNDHHTARLTVHTDDRYDVRAMGRRVEERTEDGVVTSVWAVDEPTKMVSFTYGNRYREKSFAIDGLPEVVSFGPRVSQSIGGDMIHNVGADVVNSLHFFQWLFDDPLPVERLQVTGIAAGHGQAFRGFLHVADYTYTAEHTGVSELFRAHETAHQWWGHRVGWKSYRDQWLSESLAEYSAMMYVAAMMKNGERHFQEILDAYRNMIDGSMRGTFSRYRRPWLDEFDDQRRERLGPICLGYRASNADMPQGYTVQAYYRGPLVIHMFREALRGLGDGDELFLAVLRRFVDDYAGKDATTADFVRTVNAVVPGDWTSWFDQWLCDNPRPTYTWSWEAAPGPNGQWQVTLRATQEDVPPGFVMPVPVRLSFGRDRSGRYTAVMDAPEKTFTFSVPEKPTAIELAPRHSVIATVRKR